MGVWQNRQGTGVGSCNLPQVTYQTAQDLSPRRRAAGLRAGGPRRGKGNHQSRPKEVTHGQKTEVVGQGPISCTRDGPTAAKGWPSSQTGEVKQRGSWPPRQTDRLPGRRAGRQTDSRVAVSHAQGEAGRQSDPELFGHSAERRQWVRQRRCLPSQPHRVLRVGRKGRMW